MPMDLLLRDAQELWNKGHYYRAIALLGDAAAQPNGLPVIDDEILAEIQSAAALEVAWLAHLLSGSNRYEHEEILLILLKRLNLAIVAAALRRFNLPLDLSFDEIDYAIRKRFAARKMTPASRRIYHNLYLTRGVGK